MTVKINNITELQTTQDKAISFLYSCVHNGLAHSWDVSRNKWVKPYPEVTGYLVSLFSKIYIDIDFAIKMAKKLKKIQAESGGWGSFYDNSLFTFDTAQIGMGFFDLFKATQDQEYLEISLKAAKFIISMQLENGSYFPIFSRKHNEKVSYGTSWGNGFTTINCKTNEFLTAVRDAGYIDCDSSIRRSSEWTLNQDQILYTHPGAYSLEGLYSSGHIDSVKDRLNKFFLSRVNHCGFIPYGPELDYSYVSGSVQIAILLAKVGNFDDSLKIFNWCLNVQSYHTSGGLFQFANANGSLNSVIHSEINSWGVKYYVELIELFKQNSKLIFEKV